VVDEFSGKSISKESALGFTFHINLEDVQTASVGFVVRLSGLSGHQRDRLDWATTRETLHVSFKRMLKQSRYLLDFRFQIFSLPARGEDRLHLLRLLIDRLILSAHSS